MQGFRTTDTETVSMEGPESRPTYAAPAGLDAAAAKAV